MEPSVKRILIIDDMEQIHKDFRKILAEQEEDVEFENIKSQLFNSPKNEKVKAPRYEIDSAYQGQEGLELVKNALSQGNPYALAFVDIRMPPGWDGVETIKYLWQIDPNLQIVICTAHSDYSWNTIAADLKITDNFLILKKPFDLIEIVQIAAALTKKWELKKTLLQHIENLAATVAERTKELVAAKQTAEEANLAKSQFLRNTSHELLGPLNVILGFANLLNSNKISTEEKRTFGKDISYNAQHLLQMISDIFYVSSIETQRDNLDIKPEPIDLSALINDVKEMHAKQIQEKHLDFHVTIDPTLSEITQDKTQLKRVIFHLISNAVKFTSDNGRVEIKVSPGKNGEFRLETRDSGIGIRKEDLAKLFRPFQQLDSSLSKEYEGLGMGLAVVRHAAESIHGQVGVESHTGKGSNFFVVLPKRLLITSVTGFS